MNTKDACKLLAEVKANHAILQTCQLHEFEPATSKPQRRRICYNCGGWVDWSAAYWYEKGLAHARAAASPDANKL